MKKLTKMVVLMLAFVLSVSVMFTGCSPDGGNSTMTELYVWNYDGGVGHKWLDAVETRFEQAYANESYEDGKVGVDVKVMNTKDDPLSILDTSSYSVFFLQGISYNTLASQSKFLNISDLVKEDILAGENVTIESKLSQDTQSALTAYDGNYYVLPHYQSFNGVVYNKTVFDNKDLYFAKNVADYKSSDPTNSGYGFIKNSSVDKTCGPDGVYDTEDDGLPSSIEEFERLCNYMVTRSVVPFIWFNGNNKSYQQSFVNAVWANLEGYDGVMSNFKFDSNGTETNIITGWSGDTPVVTPKVITEDNAWEIYQQESRYYTLKLADKVFNTRSYFHGDSLKIGGTVSNTDIQQTFLESTFDTEPIGMMFEGSYWENEAKDAGVFNEVDDVEDIEVRMMPLPVIPTGSVTEGNGKAPAVIDILNSYAFINANVRVKYGERIEGLAKEFLKFCYTDVSLKEFTIKSSVTKNLIYNLEPSEKNQLSSFSKSVWDMRENGFAIEPISSHVVYVKNPAEFTMFSDTLLWKTTAGDGYNLPYTGLYQTGVTPKQYFTGMAKTEAWWNGLAR